MTTRVIQGILCVIVGTGVVVNGSRALAQASGCSTMGESPGPCRQKSQKTVASTSTCSGDARERRFDTGVSVSNNVLVRAFSDHDQPVLGGWVSFGSETFRLQVDYWYEQTRRELIYDPDVPRYRVTVNSDAITDAVEIAISRNLEVNRRLALHFVAGAGYVRSRAHWCETFGYERVPPDCEERKEKHRVVLAGAGLDVSFATRYFVRVQSRFYVIAGNGRRFGYRLPVPAIVAGAGIRF